MLFFGDMMFLFGHKGPASSYPCYLCYAPSSTNDFMVSYYNIYYSKHKSIN